LFVAPVHVLLAVALVAFAVNVSGDPVRPTDVALTDCAPAPGPSVHVVCATPAAFVAELAGATDPAPVTIAQFTFVPTPTALPFASVTSTCSGEASTELVAPLCAWPPMIAMFAAAPGVTLNVVETSGVSTPDAALSVYPMPV
jgi:hypothetical protein